DQKVQHPSTKERVFLRDLSVAQINELGRKGEIIPGYNGPIFRDDPVIVNTIRDILSARATAAANFIRDVIDNPDWARPLAELGEEAPEGWRQLSKSAQDRFGPLVEGVAFREDIADALDRYVQKVFDPEHLDEFWRQYDRWLGVWKAYTLGTSPTWMANNILGNLWNGYFLADASPSALLTAYRVMQRGKGRITYKVKPGDTLSQIAEDYNVPIKRLMEANNIRDPNKIFAGDELLIPEPVGTIAGRTEAEILDMAERLGVTFRGLYGGEIKKALEEQLGRGGVATTVTSLVKPTFKANQVFENWTRLGLFIDGLQKGMSPEDAAFRVKKFLFDYTDLSETEKQVFKRIAPFYTWMRKNLPLQVEYFVTEPGKFATIPKAMSAVSSTLEDPQPGYTLPQWMQEGLYMQIGEPAPGISEFVSLRGLPPADMINFLVDLSQGKVPGSLLSANPVVNALFALQGYDTFAEREIDPNARSRIIPGVTVKDQTLQVLESLFPPIGVISRFSDPYTSPLLPERSTAERIIPQLLGLT